MTERRKASASASGPGAMAALGSIINSSAHIGDIYGVDAVPLAVAALDYTTVLNVVDASRFTGREWVLAQIEEYLSGATVEHQPDGLGQYVLVEAQAGLGKTALAVDLSDRWDCACHFTQVTGGRDARTALQSLAAQLIQRYQLEKEFAPGGMLAPWVCDPARFPLVLGAAAERAQAEDGQVRIVVDGLDEADGDGPALGLPKALPAGVQIVATYREGIPPNRLPAGDHVSRIRIEPQDPANLDDIHRFLASQAQEEEEIAASIAEAGLTVPEFIALLTERCRGVWVYLRYVLSQMRSGPWEAADLDRLPTGLADYYRHYVIGRRGELLFHSQDLVILSTLAVAEQPLTLDQLIRFTGVSSEVVRILCNYRYRPFLAIDTAITSPARYSIYHQSLREFLHGSPSPEDLEADPIGASDMRDAIQAAHIRIAEHYLAAFGGLSTSLAALSANPLLADQDDRYPLRHLPSHLYHARRDDDLHMVVTCWRHTPGTAFDNVWADTHDRTGTLNDYLAGIELARSAAERRADEQLANGGPALALATESTYTLIVADVTSRSNAISADLLKALLHSGIWDTLRATSHARRLHDAAARAAALIAVLPHLTDSSQANQLSHEALAAADEIVDGKARAHLLAVLASQLDGSLRILALDHAVAAAASIRYKGDQSDALGDIISYLDGTYLGQAVDVLAAIDDEWTRAWTLAEIADRLDSIQLGRALGIAAEVGGEQARARALSALAPHLNVAQLDRAAAMGGAIDDAGARALVLAPLATRLDGPARNSALNQVLDAAAAGRGYEAEVLAEIASHLNPAQLSRAVDIAAGCFGPERAQALAAVAAHLDGPARISALDQALNDLAIPNGLHWAETLAEVAALLDDKQLSRVLDIVAALGDSFEQAFALNETAAQLHGPQLRRAVDIAATLGDEWSRAHALTALALHLDGPARTRVLGQALDAMPLS